MTTLADIIVRLSKRDDRALLGKRFDVFQFHRFRIRT